MRQIEAWKGSFGNAYTKRNLGSMADVARREAMWGDIVHAMKGELPRSVLEVGANVGLNLQALAWLKPAARFIALEPNAKAREILQESGVADEVLEGTAQDIPLKDESVDLAFTCGVLIHVHPKDMGQAVDEIYRVSRRHIVCIEYFAPELERRSYRGRSGLLFKRDFGSFWMDRHPEMELLDYGFLWKRDTGLDNLTWWLWKK